jgi:excisionase family DNA binding protein
MSQQPERQTSEVLTFLSLDEAAAYLAVHPETIRRWIVAGHLPAKRIGLRGAYRIRPNDLDQMVRAA